MIPLTVLAHPLTQTWELPVSPLFLSAVALCVLAGAARLSIRGSQGPPPADNAPTQEQTPTAWFWAGRAIGLGLLVLAITAGLFGDPRELTNIAPVLVLGAGWPLLVLASAALGPAWQWLDPFDSLARLVAPLGAGDGPDTQPNLAWAIPAAVVWVAYLTMWPGHLQPRSIGIAVLGYTIVTLAGCLALGRRTWLSQAEVFGVFFGCVAAVRRRGYRAELPAGAHLLLATLAAGFVYGLLRDSQLLASIGYGPRSTLYSALALGGIMAVSLALAYGLQRTEERRGGRGVVAVALVPATVFLALSLALARNRFTTSLQLLTVLVTDPFGRDPQALVTSMAGLRPRPLGVAALLGVQIGLLVVGHVLGVLLAGRRAAATAPERPRRALGPSVTLLAVLVCVAVAAVAATAV